MGSVDRTPEADAQIPEEALADVDRPLEPGAMVGEYRVERKLGSGTFGRVYAGEQPLIGKRVAIKVLHRKLCSDRDMVSRFIAEARAINKIQHQNIINVFSFGLIDGRQHYFVMDLLEGLTLGEMLEREKRLDVARALPILRGIAAGLDAAHAAGITHRDLKPDNVFLAVGRDGSCTPKLLDFGVAKLIDEEMAHKTATGVAVGTPRYMSPEQARGRNVDYRTDIYALGVVAHEMLTGAPLFDGDSAVDVLMKHVTDPPPPMSSVRPELPPELDAPVQAMLAKRAKDRPASAGDGVEALAAVARSLGIGEAGPRIAPSAPKAAGARDVAESEVPAGIATVPIQRGAGSGPATAPPEGGAAGSPANEAAEEAPRAAAAESAPVPGEAARDAAAPRSPAGPWRALLAVGVVGAAIGLLLLLRPGGSPDPETPAPTGAAPAPPPPTSTPATAAPDVDAGATASPTQSAAPSVVPAPATASAEPRVSPTAPRATASAGRPAATAAPKSSHHQDIEKPPELGGPSP